jgi:hypothetical protein
VGVDIELSCLENWAIIWRSGGGSLDRSQVAGVLWVLILSLLGKLGELYGGLGAEVWTKGGHLVISFWSIRCSGISGFGKVRTEILKSIIGTEPE